MADVDPFATATELLAALRARQVSARELTDLYSRRIERYNGRLNAVVVRDFERARRQADAADQAIARGERGAARPADDDQGVVQRGRPAHHLRHARMAR